MLHVPDIGLGVGQIFPEDVKELDLAVHQAVHHLRHHQAVLFRELLHAPGGLELGPGRRVLHLLITGEDVGQRPHVAGALHVVLAAQRVDAAAFKADVSQEHLEVGAAHDVIDAAGMLGDPQGIDQHQGADRGQAAGDIDQHLHADAGNGRGPLRRILHDLGLQGLEAGAAGFDILLIIEVFGDQHVHQAIEEGDVAADLNGHMDIGELGQLGAPRVDDDELRAVAHRVLQKGRGHGMGLGHIGADHEKHLGLGKIGEGIGHCPGTE